MRDSVASLDVAWQWAAFAELSPSDLYDILRARAEVFIVEQHCPYLDADGIDDVCHHLWTRAADGRIAAYLRVVPPNTAYAEPALGRILTTSAGRGTGLGRALVSEGIRRVTTLYGDCPIRIGAQAYLRDFYARFGFVHTGRDYDEDGIPHCEMLRA